MNRLPGVIRQHLAALRGLLLFTVICGIIYPVVMFGIAQGAFHHQANGSLVSYHGRVVGSSLLCQEFVTPRATRCRSTSSRGRPRRRAAAKHDYGCDPGFSAASNLGPNNPELVQLIRPRQKQYAALNQCDLADPAGRGDRLGLRAGPRHLAGERGLQVNRVAAERHVSPARSGRWSSQHLRPHAGLPGRAAG